MITGVTVETRGGDEARGDKTNYKQNKARYNRPFGLRGDAKHDRWEWFSGRGQNHSSSFSRQQSGSSDWLIRAGWRRKYCGLLLMAKSGPIPFCPLTDAFK